MISIKQQTAKLLKDEYNIDPDVTEKLFKNGVLAEHVCRNVLIRNEYQVKAPQPKEKQRVRANIAQRFCVSVSLVEKIIF
jgi:hypothetical protein